MNSIKDKAKHILAMIEAEERGEEVQYSGDGGVNNPWFESGALRHNPTLFSDPERYRIKPKPVTRPWSKPEDVPGPVCWIRRKGTHDAGMIVFTDRSGLYWGAHHTACGGVVMYSDINNWEHSTDRKTWHPCTVTEESK